MAQSMTGFGRGSGQQGPYALRAELRSVNHRYLDLRLHLPAALARFEPDVQRRLRHRLERGRVELTVHRQQGSQPLSTLRADLDLARQVYGALQQVASALDVDATIDLVGLVGVREVLVNDEGHVDEPTLGQALMAAVDGALDDLLQSRQSEGQGLVHDLHERVDRLRALATQVEQRIPKWQEQLRERMRQRLQAAAEEMQGAVELDQARILSEIALLIDRADVTEEIVRLRAHLKAMSRLLDLVDEPIGRKADFLCQEILREVNTLGSKSCDVELTRLVIELKAELERVREQVQNIE